jgi:hypothetical protein
MSNQCFLVKVETTFCVFADDPQSVGQTVAAMTLDQISHYGLSAVASVRLATSAAQIPDDVLATAPVGSDADSVEEALLES